MERSLRDDLKVALGVMLGGVAGFLLFRADDWSMLLGGVIGLALMIIVLNVIRGVRRHRRTTSGIP
jgi:hypothetical protein